MSEQKQYWKVTDGHSYCVWEKEEWAIEMIENEYDCYGDNVDEIHLWIEPIFMTEDEFDDLEEFESF